MRGLRPLWWIFSLREKGIGTLPYWGRDRLYRTFSLIGQVPGGVPLFFPVEQGNWKIFSPFSVAVRV
jgi:hypothetical protein